MIAGVGGGNGCEWTREYGGGGEKTFKMRINKRREWLCCRNDNKVEEKMRTGERDRRGEDKRRKYV